MKVLITGVQGQLGYDVGKVLSKRKVRAHGIHFNRMCKLT